MEEPGKCSGRNLIELQYVSLIIRQDFMQQDSLWLIWQGTASQHLITTDCSLQYYFKILQINNVECRPSLIYDKELITLTYQLPSNYSIFIKNDPFCPLELENWFSYCRWHQCEGLFLAKIRRRINFNIPNIWKTFDL